MRSSVQLRNGSPEEYEYRDEGCELSPSCLRCHLARCKYDDPRDSGEKRRKERDRLLVEARNREGLPVDEVARKFDLSQRTVYRILRRHCD